MQDLSYRSALAVAVLPTPSASLKGVTVRLTTDDKPYWCNGTTWVDLTATGSASPAGNNREIQYNDAGSTAGAANVEIDNDDLILVVNNSPVTPGADRVKLFGRKLGGRVFPAAVGPSGIEYAIQPSVWRQKVGITSAIGNGTAVSQLALVSPTNVGTATARNVATTNLMSRMRRIGIVSAATAGSLGGNYSSLAQYTTGDGSGLGGFFYSCRFAFSDAAAVDGARAFVGLSSSIAAPTNVEANTLINSVGVAQLSTDSTQLYLVYGGSVAQTAIPLGTNFPPMAAAGVTNGIAYDITLFSPPGENGVIGYRLERIGTSFAAEGTLTPGVPGTQTPASTTLLAYRAWRSNNATALAVGIDIISTYIETDY